MTNDFNYEKNNTISDIINEINSASNEIVNCPIGFYETNNIDKNKKCKVLLKIVKSVMSKIIIMIYVHLVFHHLFQF